MKADQVASSLACGVMQLLKFIAALALLVSFFLPLSSCREHSEGIVADEAHESAMQAPVLYPYAKENFSRAGGWVMLAGLCGPFIVWVGLWAGRGHALRALLRVFEMFVIFITLIMLAVVLFFSERMQSGGYVAAFGLLLYLLNLSSEYLGMLWRHTRMGTHGADTTNERADES